jgi:antitoxin component YwqK of YwqJK toxin-antitoxin module
MRFGCTLLLLIISKLIFACSCGIVADFKTKVDLKTYDFVALVEIRELAPVNWFGALKLRESGLIGIDIIELFKGEKILSVTDPSFNSSCALNPREGEKWLLFGHLKNGIIVVGRCDYSMRYSDTRGMRDWVGFSGIKQLDLLRRIYDHPISSGNLSKQYYPNGNIEVEQNVDHEIINGIRKMYYPDGTLRIEEKFKYGQRTGYRKLYHLSGQLISLTKYKNGLIKDVTRYQDTTENAWFLNFQINHNADPIFGEKEHSSSFFRTKIDSLRKLKSWDKQIAYKRSYSNNGRSYDHKSYDYLGNTSVINYLDWGKQLSEYSRYKNGKLETYVKMNGKSAREIEYDYKEDGTIKEFNKECTSCKEYFGKDIPLAATPEAVYIQ